MQNAYRKPERLYFLPIGGTAMASLAGLLHLAGHDVNGVDAQLYPPMSTLLEELGIPVRLGYDPARLPRTVDRVIIGNAVPRSNPEVEAVLDEGIPHLSQAEAVAHYLLGGGRRSLVVAGTHGKTTTTSLLAWILEHAGEDPSYLVGGLLQWNRRSFRLGNGPWMVIEGDEYNTSFFDRGPKFFHYRPHVFVLGPVEFDHGDIYRDLDAVLTAFRAGTAQVPACGAVVVAAGDDNAMAACRDTAAPVLQVGDREGCELRLGETTDGPEGSVTPLEWRGTVFTLRLPLVGRHNAHNAAMAMAAALAVGVSPEAAVAALSCFPGVARRLQTVGEVGGVTVVDDFAHHPTALAATLAAARSRWPGRRLVMAYEPRSLTAARAIFQDAYRSALSAADVVLVAAPYHRGRLRRDEMIDRAALAAELAKTGVETITPAAGEDPVEVLAPQLRAGDVVLGCSSGDFGDFHRRLVKILEAEPGANHD